MKEWINTHPKKFFFLVLLGILMLWGTLDSYVNSWFYKDFYTFMKCNI